MKVTIETGGYNHRRYSRPWIAHVDFSTGPKGHFTFGEFIPSGGPGSPGLLELDAQPGDIIATGQKDYRGANTEVNYAVITDDGRPASLPGKVEALKRWRQNHGPADPGAAAYVAAQEEAGATRQACL